MRRVVITGIGIVSCIGNNATEVTASLHAAKSGISKAEDYERLGFRSQIHGMPTYDLSTVDRAGFFCCWCLPPLHGDLLCRDA